MRELTARWYDAATEPPKTDGEYLVKCNACYMNLAYKHDGWNIHDDGNREHEIFPIEWTDMPLDYPPIV